MATLEKFFCLFALALASFMSLVLCVVLSTVPTPRSAQGPRRPPAKPAMLQRLPQLQPRAPSESFIVPGADDR